MQLKTKFNALTLVSFLCLNSLTWAAQESEYTHVNVNVSDDEGKVVITKGANGNDKTTEETFKVGANTDVDALVSEILTKHGVDPNKNSESHKITEMMNHHGKNMVWVQKNDAVNVNLENGQATVIIKKDNNGSMQTIERTIDVEEETDIDALVDQLMIEHGIEESDARGHRKIIKLDRHSTQIKSTKPRMGFMASVIEEGWEIISVVPGSGAAEAGLQKGDIVISIDGQSTAKGGLGLSEFVSIDKQVGESSEILVLRNKQQIPLSVKAKVINTPDIIMDIDGSHNWVTSSSNDFKFSSGDLDKKFAGLNVDVKHLDKMLEGLNVNVENLDKMIKDFGDHEIHVVTTSDVDAYFFSGSKMNQWLGKNHHFSTLTPSLGKYFGTSAGVLVLEVDKNNKLGLKDGDVIQAINGKNVNSPKDVVKIMSDFKTDETFEIEIIREKETIYLES